MSLKFKKVYRELDSLKSKIYKKDGWFIFKTHKYSIEELLESPNHQRILSITKKIGDDIKNWKKNKNLSLDDEKAYFYNRDNIDDKLHETNILIEDRNPTFWENMKTPLIKFRNFVMENLPENLKDYLAKLIPYFFNKVIKFLPKVIKALPKIIK